MAYDVDYIREQFPALNLEVNGHAAAFFDGPGGTQTPQRVINRITDYLIHSNANSGGVFLTSQRNDDMMLDTRKSFADYFGCQWEEVSFCHNSTTISFKLANAIVRDLAPGDEIILTDMDHEANRGPWEMMSERGMVIKSVRINPETCLLDMDHYKSLLSDRTKVVAFNYGSNAVGTITDAKEVVRLAREVGAMTIVDAVHYALHGVIDVEDVGMDFLFCSAYKFFGPHLGVLYARAATADSLRTLRVGAQKPYSPDKFEIGTLNHEAIAGAGEAVEFIADIGKKLGGPVPSRWSGCSERRQNIIAGMFAIEEYELPLASYFKDELEKIEGVKLYGPPRDHPCTSTIAFRLGDQTPQDVSTALAEKGIFTWAGDFYAVELIKTLGLSETGGVVRIGLAPYNTKPEIDRTLEEIRRLA